MPITKRLITNAAVLLALVAAVALGAGYPLTPVHVAEGHGGGNYDGTTHAEGEHHAHVSRAWKNGSRCIYPDHIADKHTNGDGSLVLGPHTGFASAAYTTGPAEGTLPAQSLSLAREHIEDQWEVSLSWKASGYRASGGTWACQPYLYQAQRKIGSGAWERWNTSHPDSSRYSETRSQRFRGDYPNSDRSLYKHPTTGTPETVSFRVCNKAKDGTIGACTSPSLHLPGREPLAPGD